MRRKNTNKTGDYLMGWRSKFIFILLIYFAGFATAVYNEGPVAAQAAEQETVERTEQQTESESSDDFSIPAVDSDRILKTLNVSAQKLAHLTKDVSIKASGYIKQKIEETREAK